MFTAEFLFTSLVVVLIPGTGVIFTVSTGLSQGRRASLFASVGCTLGIVPHLLASVLGLASIMHSSALAFQVLKYAGVAYLFYLAVVTWRDRSSMATQTVQGKGGVRGLVVKADGLVGIITARGLTIASTGARAASFLWFLPVYLPAPGYAGR